MNTRKMVCLAALGLLLGSAVTVDAQDWPQWRGNHRDGISASFESPDQWPENLVKQWTVEVGDGVATPSIVGDRIYVMALQDGNEVMRCLDAKTGNEIWKDQYAARAASGPASGFKGTRSAPAVADGKVMTLGVNGTVSCWETDKGKLLWRNDDYQGKVPMFSTSSSPMIVEGVGIVQFGSEREGGVVAYDLDSGKERWIWSENGTSYASPVLMTLGEQTVVFAPAAKKLVALSAKDGGELWSMDYTQGRYNAATPVVDGQTLYLAGPNRGITALEFEIDDDKISSSEKWRNEDAETTVMYNSPILVDGMLFGLSNSNQLFCVSVADGTKAWNVALSGEAAEPSSPPTQDRAAGQSRDGTGRQPQGAGRQRGAGRGGRGRRRGGGRGGYGSIVAAGSALIGLSPKSELVVYQPSGDGFKELGRYKVSETPTYAYPIPVGNRIYIKDQNSLVMWTLE